MKITLLFFVCATLAVAACAAPVFSEAKAAAVLGERQGTLVVRESGVGVVFRFRPEAAAEKLAPCSTFKIWNTLIGLETGVVTSPGEAFYTWDGVVRFLPEWNRDLTLKQAFQASCVPAYQELARKIGSERMREWIGKLGYGDGDISAGLDVFWLPQPGRKTILISPDEQAVLLDRLVSGQLPVAEKPRAALKEIMEARRTGRGVLYGKTGTGFMGTEQGLGWFVGYVESGGKTYPFACVMKGKGVMGKDVRAAAEKIFEEASLL